MRDFRKSFEQMSTSKRTKKCEQTRDFRATYASNRLINYKMQTMCYSSHSAPFKIKLSFIPAKLHNQKYM